MRLWTKRPKEAGIFDDLPRPDIFGECLLPFTEDVDSAALMTPVQVSDCVRAVADAFIAARNSAGRLTVDDAFMRAKLAPLLELDRIIARLDEVWPGFAVRVAQVDAVRREMTPEVEIPAETDEEVGAA